MNRDKCKAVEEERSSCIEMTATMTKKMKRGGQRRRKTNEDERIRGTEMKRMEEEEGGWRKRQKLRSRIPGTADKPEMVSTTLSSFAKYRPRFLASHVYVHRLSRTS